MRASGLGRVGFLWVRGKLTDDGGVVEGLVAALRLEVLDFSDNALAVDDLAEDYVLVVKMRRWYRGDEELRAVGACNKSVFLPD